MMPSKKKKYNARFPAGRIKKIMQTDEEVGKVAQAVPVIILFNPELKKGQWTKVTDNRIICIHSMTLEMAELEGSKHMLRPGNITFEKVKNIPDVSAAEEKELQSAENSPNSNSTGYSEPPSSLRRPQEPTFAVPAPDSLKRRNSDLPPPLPSKLIRTETVTSTAAAIDLSKKSDATVKRNVPNFYQETLKDEEEVSHSSVIRVNPSYANPQPSTSQLTTLTPVRPTQAETVPKIDMQYPLRIDLTKTSTSRQTPLTPRTPVAPVINIDFTKNISNPEIHILNSNSVPAFTTASNARRIDSKPVKSARIPQNYTVKALSRSASQEHRKMREPQSPIIVKPPVDIDRINSGNLEIDEDYDT